MSISEPVEKPVNLLQEETELLQKISDEMRRNPGVPPWVETHPELLAKIAGYPTEMVTHVNFRGAHVTAYGLKEKIQKEHATPMSVRLHGKSEARIVGRDED